jgi:hypothetical protein
MHAGSEQLHVSSFKIYSHYDTCGKHIKNVACLGVNFIDLTHDGVQMFVLGTWYCIWNRVPGESVLQKFNAL